MNMSTQPDKLITQNQSHKFQQEVTLFITRIRVFIKSNWESRNSLQKGRIIQRSWARRRRLPS